MGVVFEEIIARVEPETTPRQDQDPPSPPKEAPRARVLADLAHQVTEVTVGGWNAKRGERVGGTSSGASLGPGSGRTGAELLRDALGERSHHIAHLAVGTDDEARAVADAAFDGRARRFLVVDGTADGNPALRVGTNVT